MWRAAEQGERMDAGWAVVGDGMLGLAVWRHGGRKGARRLAFAGGWTVCLVSLAALGCGGGSGGGGRRAGADDDHAFKLELTDPAINSH